MEKHFSTIDFYAAAALMAENYELVDYYRQGGFTTFIFEDTQELHDYTKIYYSEKSLIEPIKFGRAIKNLKSLIHSINLSTSQSVNNNGFNNNYKGTK
jgi:predicted AAA+ superfamily ATPase